MSKNTGYGKKRKEKLTLERLLFKLSSAGLSAVLIVSVWAVLLCMYNSAVYADKANDISGVWTDGNGNAFTLTAFHSYDKTTDTLLPQRVYYTVEAVDVETSLIFRARNCYVNVYSDGVLISEDYQANTWIFGKSPGSRWHCITLNYSSEPVEICLEVTACYENSNGYIDNIYLGSTASVFQGIVKSRFPGFIVCVFLQVVGLMIMLIYAYMSYKYKTGQDLLYLGNLTFFAAQWLSCETLLWQLFFGHSELFHLLNYVAHAAIPLSFGLLVYHRLNGKIRRLSQYYSLVCAAALVVLIFLDFFGIVEFHDSLDVVHILLVLAIPFIPPLMLSYSGGRGKPANRYIIFPLIGIIAFCVLASMIKYLSGAYGSYWIYAQVALVCFLLTLIVYQFRQILDTYSNGMRADVLADLALTDYMTGLYNRTAFNSHTAEYNHLIDSFSPLGIIQFDVNNLKKVNDTLGHEKGDMMIKAVADGLKNAFNDYGSCVNTYRTGGDEFLTIINSLNADEIYKECIEKLWRYCDDFNKQPDLGFTLQIAHGYVCLKGGKALSEAIDEADALMYENKRKLKGLS